MGEYLLRGGTQRRQDIGCVLAHVGDVVDRCDDPLWVDQVGVTFGKVCELMIWVAHNLIRRTHALVDVGQQGVGKALGFLELLVLLGGIEGCSEDSTVSSVEVFGSVTQSLSLNRSTRCGRLRVPPEQYPVAGLVGQGHGVAILVR